MIYAQITNGTITKIGSCPLNTQTTSNFNKLPDEEKKKQGWYKIKIDDTETFDWQKIKREYEYNPDTDEVKEIKIITNIELEEYKNKKIEELKKYMQPKFPETYKQINSILGEYIEEKNTEIKQKITTNREHINNYEQQIITCTTHEEVYNIDYLTTEDKEARENFLNEMIQK